MTVTPLGRDQDCSLKIRQPDVLAPWFLDPGGWSKTAAVSLYFIFPGICTLSLGLRKRWGSSVRPPLCSEFKTVGSPQDIVFQFDQFEPFLSYR
ncbi:hypothetical protein STEG23_001815 [Scotinomys teguina]